MPPKKTLKDCPPGQFRNPETNRCKKMEGAVTRKAPVVVNNNYTSPALNNNNNNNYTSPALNNNNNNDYTGPALDNNNNNDSTGPALDKGKPCKQPCEASGKICNPKTGRCIKNVTNPVTRDPIVNRDPTIVNRDPIVNKSEQPNSIVLFFKAHGAEEGNLLDNTRKLLKASKAATTLADLQENVKITLSSAASVSSFTTHIGNKIGQTDFLVDLIKDTVLEDSDGMFKARSLLQDNGYNYERDVKEKVTEAFFIEYLLYKENGYTTLKDVFQLITKIDFRHPELAIQYLKDTITIPSYIFENIRTTFYDDLFTYLSFYKKIIKENKKNVTENSQLNLYNETSLAAMNELIQFYCLDNPQHRITDAMYYHGRLLVKDIYTDAANKQFSETYLDVIKHRLEEGIIKPEDIDTDKQLIVFADRKNEKIVDVTMDEHSLDRIVQFIPNPGEVKRRTYGCHIVKAFHNGNTFCSGINEYTTEQFIKADANYNRGKIMEGYEYDNNEQFLLSILNPFIQDIIKKSSRSLDEKTMVSIFQKMNSGHSKLSDVIALCKILGFVKIYITDTCCRPNYDKNSLNIAMRPSKANDAEKIIPDDPIVGDIVDFVIPGQFKRNGGDKWSQQPGKIVDMVKGNDDTYTYTINTSTSFSGVKVVEPVNKVITSAQKRPIQFEESSNNTSWHASAEDYEQYRNNDTDNEEPVNYDAVVGNTVNFIIPETGTWSSSPGNILRVFTNSTGVSYDIEVPGDTFDNVLKVEDFIKMRTWVGGKGNKKKNEKKNNSRKNQNKRFIGARITKCNR